MADTDTSGKAPRAENEAAIHAMRAGRSPDTPTGPKKRKKKLLAIILLAVLVGGGGAAFKLLLAKEPSNVARVSISR